MRPNDDGKGLWRRGAFLIWSIPMILSLCGLVMIASLSLRNSMTGGNPYALPLKQFQFLGLGMTAMACCTMLRPQALRQHCGLFWLASLALLWGPLVPGLGLRAGGARRWISLSGINFQPLEVLLFTMPIFLADRMAASRREGVEAFARPTLLVIFLSVLPLMLQPNLGGALVVIGVCCLMHVESRGWKYPVLGGILAFFLIALLIWQAPYRMRRFYAFWDPWSDPMGKGFQIIQGLVAFANGGLTGVGIGKGLQEDRYLPEAQTDYVFPAIGEEFGLLGTAFLLALYALWTWRAYRIYRRSEDPFLSLLALGMAASVVCPMFLNLGGVMKLMPLAGVPLPFISAGGSSLLFMWAKVGVLMAVDRTLRGRELGMEELPEVSGRQARRES